MIFYNTTYIISEKCQKNSKFTDFNNENVKNVYLDRSINFSNTPLAILVFIDEICLGDLKIKAFKFLATFLRCKIL